MRNFSFSMTAGADLSGAQYQAVDVAGTLALNNLDAVGILQNVPDNTEDASVVISGLTRCRAGAAIPAGSRFDVASGGWMITATSGDESIGVNIRNSAVASGSRFEAYVDFGSMSKVTSWA